MPQLFNNADFDDHESVTFFTDRKTGMRAIIAIHSTHLGPSGGGVRMQPYATSESAITDVLRLSRGMSYKNALAGIKLGGGKAVLFGNPKTDKSHDLMFALGDAIHSLGGRYLAAEDVGMTLADMEDIATRTPYVFGRDPKKGFGGEPSPMTALGVFLSIQKCAEIKFGSADLNGVRIAVQGLGAVGADLAYHLYEAGAELILADADNGRAENAAAQTEALIVSKNDIISQEVDIFAPCALGAIINDSSIDKIKAKIICGAANNQLATPKHGQMLLERGILFAPDYVVNAGGIINVYYEIDGKYDGQVVENHVRQIPNTLEAIIKEAQAQNRPPAEIADEMAQAKIGR